MLLLDEAGFKQQRANLARRANVADAPGLAQQTRFIRIAQVRQHPAAQVDAFADIKRQAVFRFAMKHIHARRRRHARNGFAQVHRVFLGQRGRKFGVASVRQVHGIFQKRTV